MDTRRFVLPVQPPPFSLQFSFPMLFIREEKFYTYTYTSLLSYFSDYFQIHQYSIKWRRGDNPSNG